MVNRLVLPLKVTFRRSDFRGLTSHRENFPSATDIETEKTGNSDRVLQHAGKNPLSDSMVMGKIQGPFSLGIASALVRDEKLAAGSIESPELCNEARGQRGGVAENDQLETVEGIVEGGKRYWLSVAIDRNTGKVIDEQWEPVNQQTAL